MKVAPHQFVSARASRVWWPFILIVLGFVLINIVSIYAMRNSQAKVRVITKRAAIDIELVSRLSRDLDRKRGLVEDHILENQAKDMDRIEGQLAAIDAEIAAAVRAYEPIGQEADEHAIWQQLDEEIAAIEPEINNVLALSRRNLNNQAQIANQIVETQFDRIDQATNSLLEINRTRVNQEAEQVRLLQWQAVIILAALTVIWTIFALLTARWVISLIADRQDQMKRAMDLLEERNHELDAFAGRVAHDLRGPLSTISLASAQFKLRGVYDEGVGGILQRAVARMETMIRDLLTLSRAGAQTKGAACRVTEVVGALQEELRPRVESVGGALRIDVADAIVPCSPSLLREALWNLGENAVKYRQPDVQLRIAIRGRVSPDTYELIISDNGSGMSPPVARKAFEPFFRAKEAESTPGTGLGLSVVKRIIESSSGTVSVESEVGRGTTFRIHLPLATSRAA